MNILNSYKNKKRGSSPDFLKEYKDSPEKISITSSTNAFAVVMYILIGVVLVLLAITILQTNQKIVEIETSLNTLSSTIDVIPIQDSGPASVENTGDTVPSGPEENLEPDISETYQLAVSAATSADTSENTVLTISLSDKDIKPVTQYDLQLTNNTPDIGEIVEGSAVKTDDNGQAILTIKPLKSGFLNIIIIVGKASHQLIVSISKNEISWDWKVIPPISGMDQESPYSGELYLLPVGTKLYFNSDQIVSSAFPTTREIRVLRVPEDSNAGLVRIIIDAKVDQTGVVGPFGEYADGKILRNFKLRDPIVPEQSFVSIDPNNDLPMLFLQDKDGGYYLIRVVAYVDVKDLKK